jgi:sodium-dependent dicarboxylate transporter 2/3/5
MPEPAVSLASAEDAGPRLSVDRIGLALGPVVLIAWLLLAPAGGLTPQAHTLAGIMLFTILWWLTEPIPIAGAALLAIVLCVALDAVPGERPIRTALTPFAEPSVFFLLGGMFLGRAMMRHGLDRRLALALLCTGWAGRTPGTLLAAVGLAVTLISMWISNTAATAMMYPVTMGIITVLAAGVSAQASGAAAFARSPYASDLLLMTAYASSVGGIATPIGTATNVVALGFFHQYFGRGADFFLWALVGVPMMLLILAGLYAWFRLTSPRLDLDMTQLREHLRQEYERLGRWKRGEINTLIVFLIAVTLWLAPSVLSLVDAATAQAFNRRLPEEIVALAIPVLLFLLPVDWRRREFSLDAADLSRIDWGTVLLFGGALSLGNLMFQTGLAKAVGEGLFTFFGAYDVWSLTALAIVLAILLSEVTSNTAAAATLFPVLFAFCTHAGIDPVPPLRA